MRSEPYSYGKRHGLFPRTQKPPLGSVACLDDVFRVVYQQTSLCGKFNASCGTVKQAYIEFVLKALYLLGNGGLGYIQDLRRLGKIQGLHDSKKALQLKSIHKQSSINNLLLFIITKIYFTFKTIYGIINKMNKKMRD